MSAFILVVVILSGVRLIGGVFWIGVRVGGGVGAIGGGGGEDAGEGPEGGAVEQGLGVGGTVGGCSSASVGGENMREPVLDAK